MSKVMQKIPFLRLSYKKPLASVAFTYVRTVLLSLVWRSIVFAWCCSLGLWVLTEMEAVVLVPSCYNGVRIFSCVGPCLLQALWQLPRKARGTESTYCRVRDWYDSHFGCLYQFVRRLKFSLRESKKSKIFFLFLNCHVPLFVRSFSRKAKQWQWLLHTLGYRHKKGSGRYIGHNEVDRWCHKRRGKTILWMVAQQPSGCRCGKKRSANGHYPN